MTERRVSDIATRQHGVFTRAQALSAGMTDRQIERRIASGMWTRVHAGVYRIAGAPDRWRSRLAGACFAIGGLVSHRAAAQLWQLPRVRGGRVEVVVGRHHPGRLDGVRVHRCALLLPEDHRIIDSLPVTGPELTLLHLGATLPGAMMDGFIDDAIRRGLTTLPRLRWRLRVLGRRGRNGSGVLRRTLDARDPDLAAAESALERAFVGLVRTNGIPPPVLQHLVRDDRGIPVASIDVAWPERKVAVELDGAEFHAPLGRWTADGARQNRLVAQGWTPLRFTWWDVHNSPDAVAAHLTAVLGIESHGGGAKQCRERDGEARMSA